MRHFATIYLLIQLAKFLTQFPLSFQMACHLIPMTVSACCQTSDISWQRGPKLQHYKTWVEFIHRHTSAEETIYFRLLPDTCPLHVFFAHLIRLWILQQWFVFFHWMVSRALGWIVYLLSAQFFVTTCFWTLICAQQLSPRISRVSTLAYAYIPCRPSRTLDPFIPTVNHCGSSRNSMSIHILLRSVDGRTRLCLNQSSMSPWHDISATTSLALLHTSIPFTHCYTWWCFM